jgi:hypothetical protein
MKIVFLDVDGVLNSRAWWERRKALYESGALSEADHWRREKDIDPETVQRLNRILDATDAFCVLSSAWRHHYEGCELARMLRRRFGLTGEIIGRTPFRSELDQPYPDDSHESRGHEIMAWLRWNDDIAGEYICLDDDEVGLAPETRRIATSFATGLLDEHVELAIAMLGRKADAA